MEQHLCCGRCTTPGAQTTPWPIWQKPGYSACWATWWSARPHILPSPQPTETLPDSVAIAEHAVAAADREASPRGPKCLELLGTPHHSGP